MVTRPTLRIAILGLACLLGMHALLPAQIHIRIPWRKPGSPDCGRPFLYGPYWTGQEAMAQFLSNSPMHRQQHFAFHIDSASTPVVATVEWADPDSAEPQFELPTLRDGRYAFTYGFAHAIDVSEFFVEEAILMPAGANSMYNWLEHIAGPITFELNYAIGGELKALDPWERRYESELKALHPNSDTLEIGYRLDGRPEAIQLYPDKVYTRLEWAVCQLFVLRALMKQAFHDALGPQPPNLYELPEAQRGIFPIQFMPLEVVTKNTLPGVGRFQVKWRIGHIYPND